MARNLENRLGAIPQGFESLPLRQFYIAAIPQTYQPQRNFFAADLLEEQVGILFESSTPIELLLKSELIKQNLTFNEQYRIYSGDRFSQVVYVADFLVTQGAIRLIIECAGYTYHSGKSRMANQIRRDAWLIQRGYRILHFSTNDIKKRMPYVIYSIKEALKPTWIQPQINNKGKSIRTSKTIINNEYEVSMFCYYAQFSCGVCIVYKFKHNKTHVWSGERKILIVNAPSEMLEVSAIYGALCDLKRVVKIHILFYGHVYHDNMDLIKTFRTKVTRLKEGKRMISENTIHLSFVNMPAPISE